MNGRWALGGVALTMLCSAAAQSAPDALFDELGGASVEAAQPRMKPKRLRKAAAPLPPGRPVDLATEIPPAPWDVAAPAPKPAEPGAPIVAAVDAAPVSVPASNPVPAPNPGLAAAPGASDAPVVSVAEAEAAAARAVPVAVTPPLRPAFGEARTEVASAEPALPSSAAPSSALPSSAVPLPPEAPDRLALEAATERAAPIRLAMLPPRRPALAADLDPIETASLPDVVAAPAPQPAPAQPQILSIFAPFQQQAVAPVAPEPSPRFGGSGSLQQRIAYHARLNDVPEALVHRVIVRESRYNPRAVGRGGALGLMQIKHATARGLGYGGPAAGLLEAETNLTYAVKYLAGAYRVAGGDFDGAVRNYARGYYYAAKRQGLVRTADLGRRLKRLRQANASDLVDEVTTPATLQR